MLQSWVSAVHNGEPQQCIVSIRTVIILHRNPHRNHLARQSSIGSHVVPQCKATERFAQFDTINVWTCLDVRSLGSHVHGSSIASACGVPRLPAIVRGSKSTDLLALLAMCKDCREGTAIEKSLSGIRPLVGRAAGANTDTR